MALLVQPAAAQQREPTVASVQAVLADMGEWMLEYSSVLDQGALLMNNLDEYIAILERFEQRDINERTALAQLERWRVNNRTQLDALREQEGNLRQPPSLAEFGPEGQPLEFALHTARENLGPILNEIGAVLEASASLGVEGLRAGPGKSLELRQRAFFQSSLQLVRIDLRRVEIQEAALDRDHPNRPLMVATQRFYAALSAFPAHELARLDGETLDRGALATGLRQSARDMRVQTAETLGLAAAMREQMRMEQDQQAAPLMRMIARMMETFPASVAAYNGLADAVDNAAACVERGEDATTCWGGLDTQTRAPLEEIGRLERQRAEIVATASQASPL